MLFQDSSKIVLRNFRMPPKEKDEWSQALLPSFYLIKIKPHPKIYLMSAHQNWVGWTNTWFLTYISSKISYITLHKLLVEEYQRISSCEMGVCTFTWWNVQYLMRELSHWRKHFIKDSTSTPDQSNDSKPATPWTGSLSKISGAALLCNEKEDCKMDFLHLRILQTSAPRMNCSGFRKKRQHHPSFEHVSNYSSMGHVLS